MVRHPRRSRLAQPDCITSRQAGGARASSFSTLGRWEAAPSIGGDAPRRVNGTSRTMAGGGRKSTWVEGRAA